MGIPGTYPIESHQTMQCDGSPKSNRASKFLIIWCKEVFLVPSVDSYMSVIGNYIQIVELRLHFSIW